MRGVHEADVGIGAADGEKTVSGKRHRSPTPDRSERFTDRSAGYGIPQPYEPVVPGRRDVLPVWAERHGRETIGGAAQEVERAPGLLRSRQENRPAVRSGMQPLGLDAEQRRQVETLRQLRLNRLQGSCGGLGVDLGPAFEAHNCAGQHEHQRGAHEQGARGAKASKVCAGGTHLGFYRQFRAGL